MPAAGSARILAFGILAIQLPVPLLAQAEKFVRFETGVVSIERPAVQGSLFGLRLGGPLAPSGVVRWELGSVYSRAGNGFWTGEGGVEVRASGRQAAAFFGVGTGIESDFWTTGLLERATAGLDMRIGWSTALRLAAQVGRHQGRPGPNAVTLGLEFRM